MIIVLELLEEQAGILKFMGSEACADQDEYEYQDDCYARSVEDLLCEMGADAPVAYIDTSLTERFQEYYERHYGHPPILDQWSYRQVEAWTREKVYTS